MARLARLLRRIRPAIVHGHTPKGGFVAMAAGRLAGVPVRVYHLRGLAWRAGESGARARVLRTVERVTCGLAQRVFAVSQAAREAAVQGGVCAADKVVVLAGGSGNGVDAEERFEPRRHEAAGRAARERLGIPPGAPVVGFVGRLSRDKGVPELAAAWEALERTHPDAHLLLVGPPDERDPVEPAVLERLLRGARVRATGLDWDTPPLYAAMDVVALPTRREGFPNVPLEAAAMELPVVATDIPPCREAVVDGVTGTLVPEGDPAALARALAVYLDDSGLRRRHGTTARARALAQFRPRAIWEALHDEYARLLAKGRPAGRAKRALDVAVAAFGLVVLSPLFLAAAVAILVTMGPPVFFRQTRPGRDARPFRLVKFRTMREARSPDGAPLPDAERLTGLGRLLRRTSIDEIPQLWNVLKGDMSLVGPRPLLPEYLPLYTSEQARRHAMRPGMTGLTQVSGRNALLWEDRLRLDVWYVDHHTLGGDLAILARTLGKVVRMEGVAQEGTETTEPFRGTRPER